MQRPEDPGGRSVTEHRTINEPHVHSSGPSVGAHAFSRLGRESPGSDGASPYHTSSIRSSESPIAASPARLSVPAHFREQAKNLDVQPD
jgi:hypothetical protein